MFGSDLGKLDPDSLIGELVAHPGSRLDHWKVLGGTEVNYQLGIRSQHLGGSQEKAAASKRHRTHVLRAFPCPALDGKAGLDPGVLADGSPLHLIEPASL